MKKGYAQYYILVKKLLLSAGILLILYTAITYLVPFFAPFIIAIVIAAINEPVIRFFEKRMRISRKAASLISLLLTISILGSVIALCLFKIYSELVILRSNISTYIEDMANRLAGYFNRLTASWDNLPYEISGPLNENIKNLAPRLQAVIMPFVTNVLNAITSIPELAMFIVVTLLSSYFISCSRREISSFIYRQLPENWARNLRGLKRDAVNALIGYFKAMLILTGVTFIETAAGLLIIKADFALLMGLLVAISDTVPMFGAGLVMVPWIVWNIVAGNIEMAFQLAIIYILGLILRQALEPNIVAAQMGLNPLTTLIALYLGFNLFGVLGMIIGPVSIIILKSLQAEGLVKMWEACPQQHARSRPGP